MRSPVHGLLMELKGAVGNDDKVIRATEIFSDDKDKNG